jgi:hypothetical protein
MDALLGIYTSRIFASFSKFQPSERPHTGVARMRFIWIAVRGLLVLALQRFHQL